MKPVPPFFMGIVLAFWGWRTDMVVAGVLCGIILESAHLVRSRWDFSDTEFNRLWDVCTLIFVGVALVLRFSEDLTSAPYRFFQWFPLIFFLMALGHFYSTRTFVPLKAFSWFLRRKGAEGGDRPVAFGWIYFALCLVSAGASNRQDSWYYIGVAALAGAALWVNRPHRLSIPAWVVVFLLASGTGYLTQGRMQTLQSYVEGRLSRLLVEFSQRGFDPRHAETSIGQIGSIKQSSRIVLKVRPEQGPVPPRLRQGTYVRYEGGVWEGTQGGFEAIPIESDLTTWTLKPVTEHEGSVVITERLRTRRALLSLPLGTTRLRDLLSTGVETNRLGLVRAMDNPALARYFADFGSGKQLDPPGDGRFDLEVPAQEKWAVQQVAVGLNLEGALEQAKVRAVEDFFRQNNFRYTTYQSAEEMRRAKGSPLAHFLLETRAGHCEYYATATVLLLRQLGIPARYATGYAVQETEDGEDYVVRDQHAHAWAMAYLDGRWVEVDTTPADWAQAEQAAEPAWQPLKDWWENLRFAFLEWRWLGEGGVFRQAAPWLIAVLVAFLAWRIFGRRMKTGKGRGDEPEIWPGADSEFYLLERKLESAGLARRESETAVDWSRRVEAEAPHLGVALPRLVRLHYKYRFDPVGLKAQEREELRKLVGSCLEETEAVFK